MSQSRRATIVRRRRSPSSAGAVATTLRTSSGGSAISVVGPAANPAASVGSPVNIERSPMKVPTWHWVK